MLPREEVIDSLFVLLVIWLSTSLPPLLAMLLLLLLALLLLEDVKEGLVQEVIGEEFEVEYLL